MRSTALTLIFTILSTVLPTGCGPGIARADFQAPAAVALSEQFESVLYSKPELLSGSDTSNQPLPDDARQLSYPFSYLHRALDSLQSSASADLLANSEAVMVGAKDFRAPSWLGGVRSTLCYIAVLKSQSSFDFRKYARETTEAATPGPLTWKWTAALQEFGEGVPPESRELKRISNLYATQLGQSYILVSNDLKELQQLASRLTSSTTNTQQPGESRELRELLQHEMWGYRRYRHDGDVDSVAAGTHHVKPGAEALMFFVDPRKRAILLRLVLKDPSDQSAVEAMNESYGLPPLSVSSGGDWEVELPLSGDPPSLHRIFLLIGYFGFAVYL